MIDDSSPLTVFELTGLRGDNPLAFLASVGTLRVLSNTWSARRVRMTWRLSKGWQPALLINDECTPEAVITSLHQALAGRDTAPEFTLGFELEKAPKNLTEKNFTPEVYAQVASRAADCANLSNRTWADFCAAFGTDTFREEETIRDTDFRTMSGAGHQHFLEFMRKLAREPKPRDATRRSIRDDPEDTGTTEEHLRNALFSHWTYEDPAPAMRWDPLDDRRHALRADDPAKSREAPIRTMRGANRLAIEALPLFPTAPRKRELLTCCFKDRSFSWPIWNLPLTVDGLRSLLVHPEIVSLAPRRAALGPMGVVEMFRSKRLTVGKLRSFTPAIALWGMSSIGSRPQP